MPADGGAVGAIFGFDTSTATLCSNGHNTTKQQLTLIQSVEYPARHELTPEGRLKADGRRPSFPALLQTSMCQSTRTKAWCSHCNEFRPLAQSKVGVCPWEGKGGLEAGGFPAGHRAGGKGLYQGEGRLGEGVRRAGASTFPQSQHVPGLHRHLHLLAIHCPSCRWSPACRRCC
jgi:hypothetical protein